METTKSNSSIKGNILWSIAVLGLAAAFFIRSNPAVVSAAKGVRFGMSGQTVLPAKIEPVVQFELTAEYAGTVRNVHAAAGAQVQSGDLLMVLENNELSAEALAATRRMELAALRVRMDGVKPKLNAVEREHASLAQQDHLAAIERLNQYSLSTLEVAERNARKRLSDVKALFDRDLATAAELEGAQAMASAAARDLAAAREHRSRLEQEVAQTASRLRVTQLQTSGAPAQGAGNRSEFEEAQAAAAVTQERLNRLRITSPGAGTLIELLVREGERVAAGRRIGRVADLSSIMISAPVTGQVAQSLSSGQPIRVRLPLEPPKEVEARITEVTRMPDPVSQAFFIRTVVRNPEPSSVLVGLEATIEINHREQQ